MAGGAPHHFTPEENTIETIPEMLTARRDRDGAEQSDRRLSDSGASALPGQQPGAASDCGGGHSIAHQPTNVAAIVIPQHLPDDLLDRHPVPTGHRRPPFVEPSRSPTIMSAAVAGPTPIHPIRSYTTLRDVTRGNWGAYWGAAGP